MGDKIHRNSLVPGHKLNWYRIDKVLGQGGFGITYLAYNFNLDRMAAIKEYLPIELAIREGDNSVHPLTDDHGKQFHWGLDRFLSEAKTLARFEHPNIVRVMDVFEGNHTAYMVMSYEEGESLQEILTRRKTMEEGEIMDILIPILGGLQKVHATGFIHRDIKPANIFIRKDGSPVLLDFGSARQALGSHTKTLTSLVSPGYAPFEQYYSKSDEQGPWTDIYGLGATLYRAISGTPPMDAVDRSKVILKGGRDTFASASELGRGRYSERFLKAIDHALQFKEEDRPQTVAEWRKEFSPTSAKASASLSGERAPANVRATEVAPSRVVTPPSRQAAPRESAPTPPRRQSPKAGRVVAPVAILFLLAGLGWYFHADVSNMIFHLQQGKEVTNLLKHARASMAAQYYVAPPDDNALSYYRKALEIQPHNAEAKLGLQSITEKLVGLARAEIISGNLAEAEQYIKNASMVLPDAASITLVQYELTTRKIELEKKQAEEMAKQKKIQAILKESTVLAANADVKNTLARLDEARKLGADEKSLNEIKTRLRTSLESLSAAAANEAQEALKAKDTAQVKAAVQRAREYKLQAEALDSL